MEDSTKAAPNLILELIKKSPISISPWRVARFFEDESNIREEYLDKSLDTLADILPDFEVENKEIIEELQKITLLAVPMFRKLQLMTILAIIRESLSTSEAFPYIPDLPKPPAANILSHIFPDAARGAHEFERIARRTPELLRHLATWRDDVAKYVEELEHFEKEYEMDLSEEQKEHLEVLLQRAQKSVEKIEKRMESKEQEMEEELPEFERFFKVLRAEPKYSKMSISVAREAIQRVFYDLEPELREIIARRAEEPEEEPRSSRKRAKPAAQETPSPTTMTSTRRPKIPSRYTT